MTSAFNQYTSTLRNVLRRIFVSPLAGILNILVIGIALSLPTGMYVLLKNAQVLVAQFSGTPQISLFLVRHVAPSESGVMPPHSKYCRCTTKVV